MTMHLEILVVEDSHEKYRRTLHLLSIKLESYGIGANITRAVDYDDAVKKMSEGWFDIALLDLMLPLGKISPSHQYTEILVSRILGQEFPSTPYLIGLTEFEDKANKEGKLFGDKMVHLEIFDHIDEGWAERISLKIRMLSRMPAMGGSLRPGRYRSDLVILVAKYETEFLPIAKQMKWIGDCINTHPMFPNLHIMIGNVEFGKDNAKRVILACMPNMGIALSASITTQLVVVFHPRVFSMLGMCCGFSKGIAPCKLGDVIIVENCACWDEGKYDADYDDADEKFKYRPRVIQASRKMRDLFQKFRDERRSALCKRLGNRKAHKDLRNMSAFAEEVGVMPEVKIGKLFSGLSVVSDSDVIEKVLGRARDAIGLDMEVYGVYAAIDSLSLLKIEFIGIKGVADFGVQKDGDKYDPVQPVASAHSYDVLHSLLMEHFSS